ncbi:MAG: hypothetical protein ACLSCU_02140 [Eubacterium sp.]
MAKQALESQMLTLKQNFQEQGLKVDAVEVTVSNFNLESEGQQMAENGQSEQRQSGGRSEPAMVRPKPLLRKYRKVLVSERHKQYGRLYRQGGAYMAQVTNSDLTQSLEDLTYNTTTNQVKTRGSSETWKRRISETFSMPDRTGSGRIRRAINNL